MFHSIITLNEVVVCKNNEWKKIMSVFHNQVTLHMVQIWLRNRTAKHYEIITKIMELQIYVMLGRYSLIWTICHKLIWFYRNAVLVPIIFVTPGEIFGHLGHTGTSTVNKMVLPSMYISGDSVIFLLLLKQIRLHLGYKCSQRVLMWYASHTPETDEVSLVL